MNKYLFALLMVVASKVLATPVSVRDFHGRDVTLDQPAQRIIALAPHIVENVYAAGAGQQLIAAVGYSDYPEQAKQLPRVGSYRSFSLENIIAMQPDLIIVWASGNGASVVSQLQNLGIPVYIDELSTLPDIAKSMRDIGVLSGNETTANIAADAFLAKLQNLSKQYRQQAPVSVFYQIWNEPLQTLNGEHIVSDVIELCGGRNVFADAIAIAPKIGLESIFKANPEAIVASGIDENRPQWLDMWQQWPKLQATKANNLYFIPPDLSQRHTVRLLDGAQILCEQLQQAREKRANNDK